MFNRIVIFADNRLQFIDACHKLGYRPDTEAMHMNKIERIQGLDNFIYFEFGDYERNPAWIYMVSTCTSA